MFEEGKSSCCLQSFFEPCDSSLSNFQLLAVTDSSSCPRSLVEQVERMAVYEHKPSKLILRAKDLESDAYAEQARQILPICQRHHIDLVLHSHWQLAMTLGLTAVHLPLPLLATLPSEIRHRLNLSSSVHSMEEAQQALELGASTIIAGHIYATTCKADVPARGLEFLRNICSLKALEVKVFAIGGISFNAKQWRDLAEAGASGACIMSAYMKI